MTSVFEFLANDPLVDDVDDVEYMECDASGDDDECDASDDDAAIEAEYTDVSASLVPLHLGRDPVKDGTWRLLQPRQALAGFWDDPHVLTGGALTARGFFAALDDTAFNSGGDATRRAYLAPDAYFQCDRSYISNPDGLGTGTLTLFEPTASEALRREARAFYTSTGFLKRRGETDNLVLSLAMGADEYQQTWVPVVVTTGNLAPPASLGAFDWQGVHLDAVSPFFSLYDFHRVQHAAGLPLWDAGDYPFNMPLMAWLL